MDDYSNRHINSFHRICISMNHRPVSYPEPPKQLLCGNDRLPLLECIDCACPTWTISVARRLASRSMPSSGRSVAVSHGPSKTRQTWLANPWSVLRSALWLKYTLDLVQAGCESGVQFPPGPSLYPGKFSSVFRAANCIRTQARSRSPETPSRA